MRIRHLVLLLFSLVLLFSTGDAYVNRVDGRPAFVEETYGNEIASLEDEGHNGTPGEYGEEYEEGPEEDSEEHSGGKAAGTIHQEPETGMGSGEEQEPPVNQEHETSPEPATMPEQETPAEFTIVAVGDVVLGRGVDIRLQQQGRSLEYPFEKVKDLLSIGDVVFFNLETPITDSTHSLDPKGKYILKTPTRYIESIKYAGFTMANLANNHMMDYYEKGLEDTMALLDEYGIVYAGAGMNLEEARKPAIVEVKGLKVAMLGYTDMAEYTFAGNPYFKFAAEDEKPGVAPRKMDYILEDVGKIRDEVDLVIVSLHWGVEETFIVLDEMVEFAHKLIDNGVDIILGHHPHQFQGMEIYKDKPIIYSMGNFIFDQNDPENQEGFILFLKYEDTSFKSLTAVPVRTEAKTQVVLQKGEEAVHILEREKRLCEELGTTFEIFADMLVYKVR